jgi:hypothetical protein
MEMMVVLVGLTSMMMISLAFQRASYRKALAVVVKHNTSPQKGGAAEKFN